MAETIEHADPLPRRGSLSQGALGRIVRFVAIAAPLFALLYYPYPEASWPLRVLTAYIALVARASAFVIALVDPSARLVQEVVIAGRFPLQIVLDCTALDVQALYVAAVLAAQSGALDKTIGIVAGLGFLMLANLVRIAILYQVGVRYPEHFDLAHEDLMSFFMLACACFSFWGYLTRTTRALSPTEQAQS